jgi:DNA-binding transcriptional LysR family regulator
MRRLDNIDLRLLRVFVTLVESSGFKEAQIVLNLAQSTLSTHLLALERKLGGKLCRRGRGGFKLTAFGDGVYAAAKRLFEDVDAFTMRVGRDRGRLIGRLRIGIVDGVVTNARLGLQEALRRYMAYAPGVFVDLWQGTPLDLERSVVDGNRDVAIGPFSQKAPGLTYALIDREPHFLYCGRGHALFDRPARDIDQAAIEASLFSVRSYRHLDDLYRVNHPRASGSIRHMEAQEMMILSGQFIGFLPAHMGEKWTVLNQMRAIKPRTFNFVSHHYVAVRTEDRTHPVIRPFLEELKRRAP